MAASEATIHVGFDKTTAEAIAALRQSADHLSALIADMPDHDPTLRAHEDRVTKAEKELTRAFTAINEVASEFDGRVTTARDICERVSGEQREAIRELESKIENHISHGNPHGGLHHRIANLEQNRMRVQSLLDSNSEHISNLAARLAALEMDITRIGDNLSDHVSGDGIPMLPDESADEAEYWRQRTRVHDAIGKCRSAALAASLNHGHRKAIIDAFGAMELAIIGAIETFDPNAVPF